MSQELFIKDTIKLWSMENCRPAVTPGEPTTVPLPEEENPSNDDILQAQRIAGALIWLSTRTRPDIAYAQSRISSMATKAPKKALEEGQRVLRYLKGTMTVGLHFKTCKYGEDVIAYTDANFAVSRSQTGSFIKLGTNAVTWRSTKQTTVARSTADSEVQAVATTEILADYIKALRESVCLPTPVLRMKCDNAAAIILSTGEGSWKTKSAANKVIAIRELVDAKLLIIDYIPTKDQCADSLTKFMKSGKEQARINVQHLGLVDVDTWLPEERIREKLSEAPPGKISTARADFHGPRICSVRVVGSASVGDPTLSTQVKQFTKNYMWRENVNYFSPQQSRSEVLNP